MMQSERLLVLSTAADTSDCKISLLTTHCRLLFKGTFTLIKDSVIHSILFGLQEVIFIQEDTK